MEKYSVVQVAEMLRTNPETVRRWIRNGKLHAIQVSRKDGNVIEESELKRFIKNSPKYASVAMISKVPLSMGIGGVASVVATSVLAGIASGIIEDKAKRDFVVSDEDIEVYLKKSIKECETKIKTRLHTVNQINGEIREEKIKMDELKY